MVTSALIACSLIYQQVLNPALMFHINKLFEIIHPIQHNYTYIQCTSINFIEIAKYAVLKLHSDTLCHILSANMLKLQILNEL